MSEQIEQARPRERVVVIGAGMVAHRFVEAMRSRDDAGRFDITVLGDEPRPPYDRVALTSYFTGRDPEDLNLGGAELWADPRVTLAKRTEVTDVDRNAKVVTTAKGVRHPDDHLVLATGSYAAVPPVKGNDLQGCFVYRTIDDVAALRGYVEELRAAHPERPVRGAVVGGARVHDLGVGVAAERAVHAQPSVSAAGSAESCARTVTATPWLGRSSASANAEIAGSRCSRASRSYSMICTAFMKLVVHSPWACTAEPPVGSTWLEPAA